MKHLILSLLVLGFSQSLQAKLNINSPSGEKNKTHLVGKKNKSYSACANRVKDSRVKNSHVNKDVQQPNTPVAQAQDNKEFQRNVSATNKPSSDTVSSHSNKDPQKETVANPQVNTTSQKTPPTASVDDQKKQSARKPAQSEIPSDTLVCFTYSNFSRGSYIVCDEQQLEQTFAAESNVGYSIPSASKAGQYLAKAGFIPVSCWPINHQSFACIYHKFPQN